MQSASLSNRHYRLLMYRSFRTLWYSVAQHMNTLFNQFCILTCQSFLGREFPNCSQYLFDYFLDRHYEYCYYCSPIICSTMLRSLPLVSISSSTICCHTPIINRPFLNGSVRLGPISDARKCECPFPSCHLLS